MSTSVVKASLQLFSTLYAMFDSVEGQLPREQAADLHRSLDSCATRSMESLEKCPCPEDEDTSLHLLKQKLREKLAS